MISDSLLRFRVLIARFRWGVFVAAFVAVLKLKDFLGYTDAVQLRLLGVIGVFALVAVLDEYILRNRGRRRTLGFYEVMLGDVAVPSAVLLLLPVQMGDFPVLFLPAVAIAALGLGARGGFAAGVISSLAFLGVAGVRGVPLWRGDNLFWPAGFVAAGMAVGYAVDRWDVGQRHLERASYWIGKVSVAMTMSEIGEAVLECLASAMGGAGESGAEYVADSCAGALLLLDQGEDRYNAVATRNLSAEEAARLWLPTSDAMLNWVLQRQEPTWVKGAGDASVRLPRVAERFSSVLLAPLSTGGTPLGVAVLFVKGKEGGSKEVLGGMAEFCRKAAGIVKQTACHADLVRHSSAAGAILESSHNVMGQGVDEVLGWAEGALRQLLRADMAAVAVADPAEAIVIRVASGFSEDVTGRDLAEASTFGQWVLRTGEPLVVHDCSADRRVKRGSFLEQEAGSLAAIPLEVFGQISGILLAGRHSKHGFSVSDVSLLNTLGQQVGLLLERSMQPSDGGEATGGPLARLACEARLPGRPAGTSQRDAMEESRSGVVRVLSMVVEGNKPYLEGSNQRVASLAVAIGGKLGCYPEEMKDLEDSALLRDAGIVGVDPGLLERPGALSEEEMARVRQHPTVGQIILSSLPFVWNVPSIVRHHHERYDGSGYPDYLKGEQIPLCSRILAVADVFDALTSKRPHRLGLSPEDASEVIFQGAGSQFDVAVVNAFRLVYKERYDRAREESRSSVVEVLSLVVEANRGYDDGSSHRVACLAVAVGEKLGCSSAEIRDLEHSALLRDVGSLGIDASLFDRPGELAETEMARVQQHPVIGQAILLSLPLVWRVPAIVRHHHERFDGAGYPDALKGDQIPLSARVLAIADVFDALTSRRPYRKALSPKDAWEVVAKGADAQFDPQVVEAFRQVYKERYDVVSWLSGARR